MKPLVFISYARVDEDGDASKGMDPPYWLSKIKSALSPLITYGEIDCFVDLDIKGSENWEEKIKTAARRCDVFVLMLTAHSLSSDYIFNVELPIIKERLDNLGRPALFVIHTSATVIPDQAKWITQRQWRPSRSETLDRVFMRGGDAALNDQLKKIAEEIQSKAKEAVTKSVPSTAHIEEIKTTPNQMQTNRYVPSRIEDYSSLAGGYLIIGQSPTEQPHARALVRDLYVKAHVLTHAVTSVFNDQAHKRSEIEIEISSARFRFKSKAATIELRDLAELSETYKLTFSLDKPDPSYVSDYRYREGFQVQNTDDSRTPNGSLFPQEAVRIATLTVDSQSDSIGVAGDVIIDVRNVKIKSDYSRAAGYLTKKERKSLESMERALILKILNEKETVVFELEGDETNVR